MRLDEHFFMEIVSDASDLIQSVNSDGKIIYANKMWHERLEYDKSDLDSITIWDIIDEESRSHCQTIFKQLMSGTPVDFVEATFVSKSGKKIKVEGSTSVKVNEKGEVVATRGIFRDVTSQKNQYLKLLKQFEEKNDQFALQLLYTNVLSMFFQNNIEEVDASIQYALASFGRYVKADRVYIFEYDYNQRIAINTYEWCEEGVSPQIEELQKVPFLQMASWLEAHQKGLAVVIPNVFDLPIEDSIRMLLEPQEVKSLITIPMMDKDELKGFIGFDSVKTYRTYTSFEQAVLSALSDLLVGVKQKAQLQQELDQKKQALHVEEQRIRNIINSTTDVIFEIDTNKRYVRIFGRGMELLQMNPQDYIGKTAIEAFGPIAAINDKNHDEVLKGKVVRYLWQRHTKHKVFYLDTQIAPIFDESRNVIGGAGVVRDITEAKEKQDEIEYYSNHDFLTGLHNRRYFSIQMNELDIESNYPIGLIMIDLNGLKLINDVFGHHVGDKALLLLSKILHDVFLPKHLVARIGGDEFVILITQATNELLEMKIAEFQKKIALKKIENIDLSVGIGYHVKKDNDITLEDVMQIAENNMYKSKVIEGRKMRNGAIRSILQTLSEKYYEQRIHSERVGYYSRKIGEALAMRRNEVQLLELAGTLHDIGKIAVPDNILYKCNPLTDEDFNVIKNHTETGYQILKSADDYTNIAEYALTHHEHWDGNGYPMKLKGEEIPLFSRIIFIADSFEAMTSNRPYRKAITIEEAVEELKRCAGTQFDPRLIDIFIKQVLERA